MLKSREALIRRPAEWEEGSASYDSAASWVNCPVDCRVLPLRRMCVSWPRSSSSDVQCYQLYSGMPVLCRLQGDAPAWYVPELAEEFLI
eukprot:9004-Pelagomonas_calceolata.AAC.1